MVKGTWPTWGGLTQVLAWELVRWGAEITPLNKLWGSPALSKSGSNHSRAIPFRYDCMNMTLVWSVQNAFGQSWKLSSHWTKNVCSFFGLVLSKVLGLCTLVQDEDSEEHKDHTSLLIAMERLFKMTRPASSGLGMPSMGLHHHHQGLGCQGHQC